MINIGKILQNKSVIDLLSQNMKTSFISNYREQFRGYFYKGILVTKPIDIYLKIMRDTSTLRLTHYNVRSA